MADEINAYKQSPPHVLIPYFNFTFPIADEVVTLFW